jgi:hypothetical protein
MMLDDYFYTSPDYDSDEDVPIDESMDDDEIMEQKYLEYVEDEVLFPDITADMVAEEITRTITDIING